MSKINKITACLLLLAFNFTASALSWQPYDDFQTGFINTNKWDVFNVDSSGKIKGTASVVSLGANRKMRIIHYPVTTTSGEYIYIALKQYRNAIQGIRANINVHSCTGNQEARLETNFGYLNKVGSDFNVLTAQTSVRPHQNVIAGISYIDRYKPNGDYVSYTNDESWNGLYDVGAIAGKNKVVSVRVNKETGKSIYWYVQNDGLSVRHMPVKAKSLPFSLKKNFLSTRRREAVGHSAQNCIVDIDDVMVYR